MRRCWAETSWRGSAARVLPPLPGAVGSLPRAGAPLCHRLDAADRALAKSGPRVATGESDSSWNLRFGFLLGFRTPTISTCDLGRSGQARTAPRRSQAFDPGAGRTFLLADLSPAPGRESPSRQGSRKGQGVVPRRRAGYASSRYDSRRRPRACGLGDAAGPRGGRALRSPGPSARRDRAVEPRGRRSPVFRLPRTLTASVASLPPPPPAMASAAREGAGSGRRRPPPRWALPGLLLLCLWLPGGRAAGSPSAPLSELHAQLSGVEQLLEEFRRQLQQERPQEELELELRAGGDPQEGCPGPGGGGYRARPDAIIRTKDSIAAGASFLSPPAAVRDWRQCLQACCLEPHCSVAVVELPRRPVPPAAALGCSLFNCTWRGRSVSKFALHRGYSSYSLSRALRASRKAWKPVPRPSPGPRTPPEARAWSLGPCCRCPCTCWWLRLGDLPRQDRWALLSQVRNKTSGFDVSVLGMVFEKPPVDWVEADTVDCFWNFSKLREEC
ncbi:hypothetical protein ABFV05_007550 [Capra hircus]